MRCDLRTAVVTASPDGYPNDLRDAGWARLSPLILEASPDGRPRKTDMRAAMKASSICCALAALGAICPATAFRPARPSTTSFASSKVMASGGDPRRAAYGAARADGPRGQPLGCGSRQPVGQIG